VQRASVVLQCLDAVLASSQICSPASSGVNDAASSYRQTALAIPYRLSTLWEQHLESLHQKLNPAILLDRQQANDLRASGNDDRNNGSGGGVHKESTLFLSVRRYFCLPTVISICLTLVSRSARRSLLSFLSS